ncbi:MAG: hypothetical protein CL428_12945 [Acidimicrobiaceae bacterium]|nr:hypothetical protein [Acidimicrobiaceae bacterium]
MNRRKGHPSEPVADGMGGIKPVVMVPDDNARTYAETTAPAQIDGDSPALHSTEEMRRLATPWSVAIAKAKLLASCQLPPGVILDPACGSGTQLAALCTTLQRPGLGVELSGAIAPLAAVNLERCEDSSGGDWSATSRVMWGDGTAAAAIIQAYHQHIDQNPNIALLHVDPARPNDAQQHTLNEMEPRLDELLTSWAPFLSKNPALILDVSPRLLDTQRLEIESIVSSIWGTLPMTWQWLTQGRGRIDRLSLWVGAASGTSPSRLVRLTKTGEIHTIEGVSKSLNAQSSTVQIGDHLVIADPCLIASGLGETWKSLFANEGGRWDTVLGRRPIFISPKPPFLVQDELNSHKGSRMIVESMIQSTGEVVATIQILDEESISDITRIAANTGIHSLKLRCSLDPDLQPKLQSKIDREMRAHTPTDSTRSGFIAETSSSHVICKEYD